MRIIMNHITYPIMYYHNHVPYHAPYSPKASFSDARRFSMPSPEMRDNNLVENAIIVKVIKLDQTRTNDCESDVT